MAQKRRRQVRRTYHSRKTSPDDCPSSKVKESACNAFAPKRSSLYFVTRRNDIVLDAFSGAGKTISELISTQDFRPVNSVPTPAKLSS